MFKLMKNQCKTVFSSKPRGCFRFEILGVQKIAVNLLRLFPSAATPPAHTTRIDKRTVLDRGAISRRNSPRILESGLFARWGEALVINCGARFEAGRRSKVNSTRAPPHAGRLTSEDTNANNR